MRTSRSAWTLSKRWLPSFAPARIHAEEAVPPDATRLHDLVNDLPRQKLAELIARHGTSLAEEPRRVAAFLKDEAGDRKLEVSLLVAAAEEGIPEELLRASGGVPSQPLLRRLERRLQQERGLSDETARWAVESWATALRFKEALAPQDQLENQTKKRGGPADQQKGAPAPPNLARCGDHHWSGHGRCGSRDCGPAVAAGGGSPTGPPLRHRRLLSRRPHSSQIQTTSQKRSQM